MENLNQKLIDSMNQKGIEIPRPATALSKRPITSTTSNSEKGKNKDDPFRVRPITPAPAPLTRKSKDLMETILTENIDKNEICRICNVDEEELDEVRKIELKIDLKFSSLQEMGDLLPNLLELRLSNSRLSSLRDIGTSCSNLRTLWVNSCGLNSLSGMNGFPSLKELFASYNEIIEVSDLAFHEGIEILDLEGNEIADIEPLTMVSNLKQLTLAGNLISDNPNYKEIVTSLLPDLESLDEGIDEDLHTDKENYKIMKNVIRKAFEGTKESEITKNQNQTALELDEGQSDLLFDNENAFCANACKLLRGKKKGMKEEAEKMKDFTRESLIIEEEKYFNEYFEHEYKLQKNREEESKTFVLNNEGNFEIYELDDSNSDFSENGMNSQIHHLELNKSKVNDSPPKREISTANSEMRASKMRRPSLNANQGESDNISRLINDSNDLSALDLQKSNISSQESKVKKGLPIPKLGKLQPSANKLAKVQLSNSGIVTGEDEMSRKMAFAKKFAEKGGLRQMRLVKNNQQASQLTSENPQLINSKPLDSKPSGLKKFIKIGSNLNSNANPIPTASKGLLPHISKSSVEENSFSKKRFSLKKPLMKKAENSSENGEKLN